MLAVLSPVVIKERTTSKRVSGPYGVSSVLAILGLALVPTVFGHSLYNYALGSVKTVTANFFPLLEPIIASLFAVSLFNETPTLIQVIKSSGTS